MCCKQSFRAPPDYCYSYDANKGHVTTQGLTVKSELKYEERVTLKFNIASLALSLSFDLMLKLSDLFTGV